MKKLLCIFLFLGPILDVVTAFMLTQLSSSFTLGVLVRFFFCFFLVLSLLFLKEPKAEKKKTICVLFLFVLYFVSYLVVTCPSWEVGELFFEAKCCLRTFYFPLLLFTLYKISKQKEIQLPMSLLAKVYSIYLLLILLPNLFGIGLASYQVTKEGRIGLFYSANEVSAILSILMPFFFYFLYQKKSMIKTLLGTFLLVAVLLSIGTKGPLLSFGICLCVFLALSVNTWIRQKDFPHLSKAMALLILILFLIPLVLPKTSFYKNIKVHLDFLKVDSVIDIFKEPHLIDHFIFSSRITFWYKSEQEFEKSTLQEKLFGLGYQKDKREVKLIEMDPMDVFYRQGIVGFLLYFGVILQILRKQCKEKAYQNLPTFVRITTFLLITLLSFFTGHILLAPAVSIFVAYILIFSKNMEVNL